MSEELRVSAYAVSIAGQEQNLDNVYVNGRYLNSSNSEERSVINKVAHADFQVYGVCDGQVIGGEASTEEVFPAAVAMQRLQRLQNTMAEEMKIDKDRIWNFLVETNRKMKEYKAAVQAQEVQASFAGLFLHGNRGLAVHLGDSRIYVIRGGRMLQITEDHLEATDLYKFGIITEKQAEVHRRNSHLTAYLGMEDIYDAEDSVFSKYFVFYPDDIFIICSDGITDYVSNEMLERIMRSLKDATADEVAERLIEQAANQSEDDMSIVVLKVDDAPGGAAPVRGTQSMPKRENFEKPAEPEEPQQNESDTTRLSRIMQGIADDNPMGDKRERGDRKDKSDRRERRRFLRRDEEDDYDDDYDDGYDDEYDEESIIDKILGNPKRLAIILGGVLIVVVLLVLVFGRGGDDDVKKPLTNSESSSESLDSSDSSSLFDSSSLIDSSASDPGAIGDGSSIITPNSDSDLSGNSTDSDASGDSSSSVVTPSQTKTHTVQAGDTMWAIITAEYGSYSDQLLRALEEHNNIDGSNLQVGETIELPTLAELGLE